MRLYKRTYGLRQICNIAVYIVHSACTIHLLNLPEKTAKRDIIHGVKHLEEIAEDWLCARRTLSILSVLGRKWKVELPEEAATVFARTDARFGHFSTADVPSPKQELVVATPPPTTTTPSRAAPALQPTQNHIRSQNQLQQSLYSYQPDNRIMSQNYSQSLNLQNSMNSVPAQSAKQNQSAISNGIGSMTAIPTSPPNSIPYARHPYAQPVRATPNGDFPRSNSGVTSDTSGTVTRQVSPNTMFGGVDALVESQDWWLRDQASLAVGFDNWMDGGGSTPELNGTSTGGQIDAMTGIGGGFYMPPGNGRENETYGDDDWTYS